MIKSISFLVSPDQRDHILCNSGRFKLERKRSGSRRSTDYKTFSAKELVNYVKNRDPFITLDSGEKLRVFRGGDPTDEVIEAISIVEVHDEKFSPPPASYGLYDYGW